MPVSIGRAMTSAALAATNRISDPLQRYDDVEGRARRGRHVIHCEKVVVQFEMGPS